MSKNKFYVTTPIYYINDVPHIGHAYSTIAADVLARYYRSKLGSKNVLFTTGTDENSQKTIEAAIKKNVSIDQYTNDTAKKWQNIFDSLDINYDRFIRTTDKDHVEVVQSILQKVYDNGDIYKGTYEGLYCVGHEAFMKEEDLVDGLCPDHNKAPERIKEENYFFKLSKYQDKLKQYILDNPDFIRPESRRNEVLAFVERGLEDFSISRESQSWGIKLPFDENQVAYVWFDALINYVTSAGYGKQEFNKWWPADLHIVGKDIIKFHCIYWPAMLWSAGLEAPKQIYAHGFFTINGQKISKSLGNAIDPIELAKKYGNDALRYYLLREISFGSDGDFSFDRFESVYNSDLANNLGNLVSRVAAMLIKYNEGNIVKVKSKNIIDNAKSIEKLEFHTCLTNIFYSFDKLNELLEKEKPWEKAKQNKETAVNILSKIATELKTTSEHLKPFLPDTADKIQRTFKDNKVDVSVGILFPKVED